MEFGVFQVQIRCEVFGATSMLDSKPQTGQFSPVEPQVEYSPSTSLWPRFHEKIPVLKSLSLDLRTPVADIVNTL
jgi:hypothetical protein